MSESTVRAFIKTFGARQLTPNRGAHPPADNYVGGLRQTL
jgi:hypothetical protein